MSTDPRFTVRESYIDGFAVVDSQDHTLVISSFGDMDPRAKEMLQVVADCLNAATTPEYNMYCTDQFKRLVHEAPSLVWRVIEHLSFLYRRAVNEVGTR